MGVPFEKGNNAADMIWGEAEYICRLNERDVTHYARDKLSEAFSKLAAKGYLRFKVTFE